MLEIVYNNMVLKHILVIGFLNLAWSQNLTIVPEYVMVGEEVTFSCYGPPTTNSGKYQIKNTTSDDTCTSDCQFTLMSDDGCWEDVPPGLGSCYCDGEAAEQDICPTGTSNVTFTVKEATKDMFITWSCKLNVGGAAYEDLKEFVPSSPPQINGSSQVVENETSTFTCVSDGGDPSPSFSWYRVQGTENREKIGDGKQLDLAVTREWNGDVIECSVSQYDGREPQRNNITLDVYYSYIALIAPCEGKHIAVLDDKVELFCNYSEAGNPSANLMYNWYKDDAKISHSEESYVISEHVDVTDNGIYTCDIDNGVLVGRENSSTEVVVQYHPKDVNISGEVDIIVHKRLQLTCTSDALPNHIEYTWTYPNGGSSEGQTLVIEFVEEEHEGEFECTAVNTIHVCGEMAITSGSSSKVAVNVFSDPKIPPIYTAVIFLLLLVVIAGLLLTFCILLKVGIITCNKKADEGHTRSLEENSGFTDPPWIPKHHTLGGMDNFYMKPGKEDLSTKELEIYEDLNTYTKVESENPVEYLDCIY